MALDRPRFAPSALAAVTSFAALAPLGCGAATERAPSTAAGKDDLNALYDEAIHEAAVFAPGDELQLVPLAPGADGTFTVTTWAGCRGAGAPNRCGSYVPATSVTLKWDVWVSGGNEVRTRCSTWTGDVVLQIQELLGMPPPQKPMPPETTERQFVTFSGVPATSIFRPCTDPRIDTDHCSGTTLPASMAPNAPPDYYKWFANQAMSAWQISPKGQAAAGFPWTRLGYTYNWTPGAPNHYGASEYVISGGSKAVTVNVVAVQTAKEFCRLP